jgi:chlorobactene glucosyltransferase
MSISLNNIPFLLASVTFAYCMVFWAIRIRQVLRAHIDVPVISAKPCTNLGTTPLISVIVPAHNEEDCIVECLTSVIEQDYPCFEVILVDDRSQDQTAKLARSVLDGRGNCKLITITDLPSGWTGKCHALHAAVPHARGEWLAFLDADSLIHRSALSSCYCEAVNRKVGMITLSPRPVLRTFWERALQPVFMGLSGIIYPLPEVNDPSSPVASANGMFYLISRAAYQKIGGHGAVRGLAVEDIGIGKRVKAMGLGLLFANGREVLRTRMYTGFVEIVRGWTRIHSASLNYQVGKAGVHLFAHLLISLPVFALALYLYVPSARELLPTTWLILPCIPVAEAVVATTVFYRFLGVPVAYSMLASLGNVVLVGVLAVIIKKIILNEALQWRGTTYSLSRYRPTTLEPGTSKSENSESTSPKTANPIR